jgi:hypothetical protein
MGRRRPYNDTPPRGSVVDDPEILALADGPDPGTRPRRRALGRNVVVTYSATRVNLKRDAWEMLAPGDVLVVRIRPQGEPHWTIAMTLDELEHSFGEVKQTRSWENPRWYNFRKVPPAALSYVVGSATTERRAPVRRTSPPPEPVPAAPTAAIPEALADEPWLSGLPDDPTRVVFALIAHHGVLTEAEITRIMGGPRRFRSFSNRLEAYLRRLPFGVEVEPTPSGKRYLRAPLRES